jgi:hypothetical protein
MGREVASLARPLIGRQEEERVKIAKGNQIYPRFESHPEVPSRGLAPNLLPLEQTITSWKTNVCYISQGRCPVKKTERPVFVPVRILKTHEP